MESPAANEPPSASEHDPRYELFMALAVANRELTGSQYKMVLTEPFVNWPHSLQEMLRPYAAEDITTREPPRPWMKDVPDLPAD